LAAAADLLSPAEHERIVQRLAQAAEAQASADIEAVRSAAKALSLATDAFAALRMDRSIRAALSGRRLDELAK
jgi:molecular chaperone HscA